MIDNYLKELAKHLNIRFPNAEFSKNLETSKGVVSEYLNNKKQVSENFILKLENFYDIDYKKFLSNINSNIGKELSNSEKYENEKAKGKITDEKALMSLGLAFVSNFEALMEFPFVKNVIEIEVLKRELQKKQSEKE